MYLDLNKKLIHTFEFELKYYWKKSEKSSFRRCTDLTFDTSFNNYCAKDALDSKNIKTILINKIETPLFAIQTFTKN